MSRYHSYLNTAVSLLDHYRGAPPFPEFSKEFFSRDKKYGSTDRKQIRHLCYCYFRLGKSLPDLPVPDRIIAGLFLCSDEPNQVLETLKPEWNASAVLSLEEKKAMLGMQGPMGSVFPLMQELSEGIEEDQFNASFFVQPDLFLRLRPGKEKIVAEKLKNAGINFQQYSPVCLALPNGSNIETVIELDREAVVQDYNSQRIGEMVRLAVSGPATKQLKVWDCCAASGGKSIMVKDILGDIDLTVSDIRESILANLKKRFAAAGINGYKGFVADLSQPISGIRKPVAIASAVELLLADVPCTGSGTWARTPEQLFYFEEGRIAVYARKQQEIITNVVPALKPGGYLLYSTCSVFKKENEDIVDFMQQHFHLILVEQQLLKGYARKADTLFAALLQKPL